MAATTVYRRSGKVLVVTLDQSASGFWVEVGVRVMDGGAPADALGQAVLHALSLSRLGVPDPDFTSGWQSPVLATCGVKTYAAFMKGARAVSVDTDGDGLLVTPLRNGGAREGFVPAPAGGTHVTRDPDAVGRVALAALDAET